MIAAEKKDEQIAEYLLLSGADVNQTTVLGQSALRQAALNVDNSEPDLNEIYQVGEGMFDFMKVF